MTKIQAPAGQQPVFVAHGVTAGYGRVSVVHDVGLELAAGSYLGVIGANGAGKSTLLKALAGVITPRCTAILGAGPVDEVVLEAAELRADFGIASFKVKVGTHLDRDIRLVERLRKDHPAALIYVDANHGYSAADALSFLAASREHRLAWIEEPCPADDVLGRADVVAGSGIPVLGDESCTTPREVVTEILARRCTAISIKLARTGIRASVRIREFCAAVGAPVLVGSQGDSGIGTYASVSFAAATPATADRPAELAYFLNLLDDLVTTRPAIEDGMLRVPDGPGFGFDVDEDKLTRLRTDDF